MYVDILLSLATLKQHGFVAGVGIPIDITKIIARSVGSMLGEHCGGQQLAAGVFACGGIAAQRALSLQAHTLDAAQKALVEQRLIVCCGDPFRAFRLSFTAKNSLEPHHVDPLECAAGLRRC